MSGIKILRVDLDKELAKDLETVRTHISLQNDSEFIRYPIREKARETQSMDASRDASDEGELYYVVDYDIPRDPTIRSRFYRAIRRWLAENRRGFYTWRSTQSVIITDDSEYAQVVFEAAARVSGKARIYIAIPVTKVFAASRDAFMLKPVTKP
ncbi:MAG: hypothetical protein B9J98_01145 [Candidatus Terraquivivens tikiterensis]|uniref:Uncharacterized protein n=1 Tax=Candidatus Terraquivivens tikiterensis TaxID=1980982 RepID=A0A2R7Y9Q5_9ARCH|nr:MAG: hypothetical protein B9J98_01145 [Candidatus Terraquivivens tikiterensis]